MRAISIFLLSLALLCIFASGEQNPADYPMKLSVLDQPSISSHSMIAGVFTYTGSGHANLQDGDAMNGVEYSYDCSFRVIPSTPEAPYPAKWLKPQTKLKILAAIIGQPGKFTDCEVKATVVDGVYVRQSGQVVLISKAEYASWKAERQPRNPADYSLKISLIEENAGPSRNITSASGTNETRIQGSGRGNLYAGPDAHGFEFTYDCGFTLFIKRNYPARWVVPQQQLEVLRTGAGQNFEGPNVCELKTTMKQEVYVTELGAGVTGTVSPDEFSKRNGASAPPAPAATPAAAAAATDKDANIAKVTIHSQPDGADIEVDGNYVGSTPSTLNMAAGPHKIVVRKRGFEDWQRQIQIMGGETQVRADLEEKKTPSPN